jgi:hypothetical protein
MPITHVTHVAKQSRIVTRYQFVLGAIIVSRDVDIFIKQNLLFAQWVHSSLRRHAKGDWGELCAEDSQLNDLSVSGDESGRLFSSYDIPKEMAEYFGQEKLWIITEWDRSVTTLLFPSDY